MKTQYDQFSLVPIDDDKQDWIIVGTPIKNILGRVYAYSPLSEFCVTFYREIILAPTWLADIQHFLEQCNTSLRRK